MNKPRTLRGESDVFKDAARKALAPGWRVSANGNYYYESRRNRADTEGERAAYKPKETTKKTAPKKQPVKKTVERPKADKTPYGREFYPVSESLARLANDMNSQWGYKEGSQTAEYRNKVVRYEKRMEDKKKVTDPLYHAKMDARFLKWMEYLAKMIDEGNRIEASCPSVLVSGASNFPVRKKEKQNARRRSWSENYQKLEEYYDKILRIGTAGISSDDADAITKLEHKIEYAEKIHADMKKANAYYRKHKTLEGCDISQEVYTQAMRNLAVWKRTYGEDWKYLQPFDLTNNNAKIRAAKERLESLKKHRAAPEKPTVDIVGGKIVQNKEINRLQIFFDGVPEPSVRAELKSHGFKWAPSQKAWQRQLTNNAIYDLKLLIKNGTIKRG